MSAHRKKKPWTAPSVDALRLHFNLWLMRAHAAQQTSPPGREPAVAETPRPTRRRKRRQA